MFSLIIIIEKLSGSIPLKGFPLLMSRMEKLKTGQFSVGYYTVTKDYYDYLTKILDYHEHESPISQEV